MDRYKVQQIKHLPFDELNPMLEESQKEGFKLIHRLITDYQNGDNRFDQPGEALFAVYHNKQLIGIGGLNRDPYLANPKAGRIRHVYILNQYRRAGVGKQLLSHIIQKARPHFDLLTLRTYTKHASLFYENFGFQETTQIQSASHFMTLK